EAHMCTSAHVSYSDKPTKATSQGVDLGNQREDTPSKKCNLTPGGIAAQPLLRKEAIPMTAIDYLTTRSEERRVGNERKTARHTRFSRDWSSDVCSSDLKLTCAQAHM